MQSLNGKCVFITGGAGGIGMGLARAFAGAGMKVALTDVDSERLDAAVSSLRGAGVGAMGLVLDVTSFEDWGEALNVAEAAFGPIAVLCNNAGLGGGGPLAQADPKVWRRVIEVNALGPFYGCRQMLPRMLARSDEAHIVNVASLAGLRSDPGISSYDASKHALVGMSDSLRAELEGTHVGLSVVYPGIVNTGFTTNSAIALQRAVGSEAAASDNVVGELHLSGMNPDKIGERVLRAVLAGEYHVFTHGDWKPIIEAHFAQRIAAFGPSADPDHHDDIVALFASIAAARK